MTDHIAKAQTTIEAPTEQVWEALVNPAMIKKYMFGTNVSTDWLPGSAITWAGEYEGRAYEDKGEILDLVPQQRLEMTHFSPLSGKPDSPENYHHLIYDLRDREGATELTLSQDGNASPAEAQHSQDTWQQMLDGIKELVESK